MSKMKEHFFHAAHCAVWCFVWHLADAYFNITGFVFRLLGLGFN